MGKEDKSIFQSRGSKKYTKRVINRIEKKFITIPFVTISGILK